MAGPFLIGRRVQLRNFEEEDAPILSKWINDPELRNYIDLRFPTPVPREKEWIASLYTKHPTNNLAFGIELKVGRRLIGTAGLHMIDWVHRRAMTGMFLIPASQRGKGYGTEAKNLLLDYAFGELGMHSIWAIVHDGNERSMRALESQGYRRSGVHRKTSLIQGIWVDSIYFDILREEWEALRGITQGEGALPASKPASKPRTRGSRK